jgi:hypothetical protein
VETSVSRDNISFSSVLDSNLTSVFPISTSFKWLMMFCARGADGFGHFEVLTLLIRVCEPLKCCDSSCALFTFKTTLWGPSKRTDHLFSPFPTLVRLLALLFFVFGSVVREPTPILYFDHLYQFFKLIKKRE